jgi:hypothetical protein
MNWFFLGRGVKLSFSTQKAAKEFEVMPKNLPTKKR